MIAEAEFQVTQITEDNIPAVRQSIASNTGLGAVITLGFRFVLNNI